MEPSAMAINTHGLLLNMQNKMASLQQDQALQMINSEGF
jgi:hypothetical protein